MQRALVYGAILSLVFTAMPKAIAQVPSGAVIQTDTSGLNTDVIKKPMQQPVVKENLSLTSDERYQFQSAWLPFKKEDNSSLFLPTKNADYKSISDEHISLADGAVIVKTGDNPAFVSTIIGGQRVMTRLSHHVLAMVSTFDNKTTILNLADKCCGALITYVPTGNAQDTKAFSIKMGQIAEIYAPDQPPAVNMVAGRIVAEECLPNKISVLCSNCQYIHALRIFNLKSALDKSDIDRILKNAAATSIIPASH